MSTKHTPGEWLIAESGTFVYALNAQDFNRFSASMQQGSDDDGKRICIDELKANARLIAAAPELLEALKKLLSCWTSVCNAQGWDPDHVAEACGARAAIAKATGSTE